MRIVITGGSGFLGLRLARRLLEAGAAALPDGTPAPIDDLVLLDRVAPDARPQWADERLRFVTGEVGDVRLLAEVVDRDDVGVFHLASMVSAGCEADFDAALLVNIDGARALLEACRARGSSPRVVFTSSIAAFGGQWNGGAAGDATKLTPETTYGMTKAVCELLVNDYTRKGFVDGRSARLATVIIRPGRPNAAATSWVSGIFREPLGGDDSILPVGEDLGVPVAGYRGVVENLLALQRLDGAALGADRGLNFPALNVTAGEMVTAIEASGLARGHIAREVDPGIDAFFRRWAPRYDQRRALDLGLLPEEGLSQVIADYVEDYLAAGS